MAQKYQAEPKLAKKQREIVVGSGNHDDDWVLLGKLAERGPAKSVLLDLSEEHVLSIVGKRGSGKSFSLGSVLEGLCVSDPDTPVARSTQSRGAILFDPLNIFQWTGSAVGSTSGSAASLREQERLLRDWGLVPVGLNVDLWTPKGYGDQVVLRTQPLQVRTQDMAADDWADLIGADMMLDPQGQLISLAHAKVSEDGWNRLDQTHVPVNKDYAIEDLVDCINSDDEIAIDYASETRRAVRQRLGTFAASGLFSSGGTGVHELVRPGRLSVVLLSGVPDDVRMVIVMLVIRKLLSSRSAASEAAKSLELGFAESDDERTRLERLVEEAPPKTWVVIDEAQNIFPSERSTGASSTLLRYVREGRNFGLSMAFTTQQPSAIDSRIMAQVDTLFSHTLTVDRDIRNVTSNLKSSTPKRIDLNGSEMPLEEAIRRLEVGQILVTNPSVDRCFFVDVRPRVSIHGGYEG